MKKVLYATTNPGKFTEVQKVFAHHKIDIINPQDLGLSLDIEETGKTLEENAYLKASAYLPIVPNDFIVIADDTGLEIEALNSEPGIKVRRWKGYNMTDEEIIEYTIKRLEGVPQKKRVAQFHTVLAVGIKNEPYKYFHGYFRGQILTKPRDERIPGMPFFPLFYLDQLGISLGEFHQRPISEQLKFPTHRELAALAALPYLRQLIGQ